MRELRNPLPGRRRGLPPTLALILALPLLASCSLRPRVLVVTDPAYAAIRPDYAKALSRSFSLFWNLDYLELPLETGVAELLERIEGQGNAARLVVASPLMLRAIKQRDRLPEAARNKEGVGFSLVALESSEAERLGYFSLLLDPSPAYARAGKAMGAHIRALREEGSPRAMGAILFSEGWDRPREALEAFEKAFTDAAGFPPARSLSAEVHAESAVRDLLAQDVRAILIAAGSGSLQAARAAEGPGRVLGLALNESLTLSEAAFSIVPDALSFRRALFRLLKSADIKEAPRVETAGFRLRILSPAKKEISGGMALAKRLKDGTQ